MSEAIARDIAVATVIIVTSLVVQVWVTWRALTWFGRLLARWEARR